MDKAILLSVGGNLVTINLSVSPLYNQRPWPGALVICYGLDLI